MNAFRSAGPRVEPRGAATTLVLRDGASGLEVLMVRRSPHASFMPGAYVFPGGAVDAADGEAATAGACDEAAAAITQRLGTATQLGALAPAFAVAALRECFEECGLWLGAADAALETLGPLRRQLHAGAPLAALAAQAGLPLATSFLQPWARWVTPVGLPKRFDTLFLVAQAPAGQVPEVDAGETTTLAWVHPPLALEEARAGRFAMEFATQQIVASLGPHAGGTVRALLDFAAAGGPLPVVHPRLRLGEEGRILGVMLPGTPGYEDAPGDG